MPLRDQMILAEGAEASRPVFVVTDADELADAELSGADVVLPWDLFVSADSTAGLALQPSDDVLSLDAETLLRAKRIVLSFPTLADGRAYTQARLLRERVGFSGPLRAVGEVLRDQTFYLQRCGFDELEPGDGETVASLARGWSELSVTYQPAADEPLPLYRRAHRAAAAESA